MQIVSEWNQVGDGVVVRVNGGTLKLQVCSAHLVRVIYTYAKELPPACSDVVIKDQWAAVPFTFEAAPTELILRTTELHVTLSRLHGTLRFCSADGRVLLQERRLMTIRQAEVQGENTSTGTLNLDLAADEGIYGLGQFLHGQMNQRRSWEGAQAAPLELSQDNDRIAVPCFLSTRGYGLLFNTYGRMTVSAPLLIRGECLLNDAVDFYFMYGLAFDRVVACYRDLTGTAPMFPKWAYGFWQSRCYYDSRAEMEGIAREYRRRKAGLDAIVVDYFHWRNGCGSFEFDPEHWPDPKAMIDNLHKINVRVMVSVWPFFQPGNPNYDELDRRGWLLKHPNECFLGRCYDAFNPEAGQAVWKMVEQTHLAAGVDAWWLDASEPEDFEGWFKGRVRTAAGICSRVLNTFSLRHTGYFYHGQRAAQPDKRVYILTRSSYAGQQRHAAAAWSGDINDDFAALRQQIPAGLNFCATGLPYWATDIGGFKGNTWTPESIVRWFQYGTFCPIFHFHGDRPANELWSYGEEPARIMANYSRLRYRLLPYIYSLAHKVTTEGYTMMRVLAFDFREDVKVREIADQFMFGPAFLVSPVTEAGVSRRATYLPGEIYWHNFWNGNRMKGGGAPLTMAPLDILPLHVRGGSIVPFGPDIQHVDEVPADPIELRIYPGADSVFDLYEDDGASYRYESGASTTIPLQWNDATATLTIGARQGEFPGMLRKRTFRVVRVGPYRGVGIEPVADDQVDAVVPYDGKCVTVSLK